MELEGAQLNAAQLVKDARHAAQQTQASMAARAGVSRGTVAAIETGARSPSLEMLSALMAAAGKQIKIELGDGGQFELEVWLRTFLVRFVPPEDAARAVLVVGEHGPLRVQPLHEIETTDRDAARVLRLLRKQPQDLHA